VVVIGDHIARGSLPVTGFGLLRASRGLSDAIVQYIRAGLKEELSRIGMQQIGNELMPYS
jgi:hypothetical protein